MEKQLVANLAAEYVQSHGESGKVRATLRANYEPDTLRAFVEEVMRIRAARTSADVRELSTVIKSSVPRDEDKQPMCAVLTVKFKLQKDYTAQGGKVLQAHIVEAPPAKAKSDTVALLAACNSILSICAGQDVAESAARGVQHILQCIEQDGLTEAQAMNFDIMREHCDRVVSGITV